MDDKQQELLFKLSVFEQQIRQLQQQINAIEQGVFELETLNVGLDEIKNSEGKETMSSIGRGIFVKTKILSEDLTVDVGEKNFVKKTVEETKEMIKKQIVRLEEAKKEMNDNLFEMGKEAEKLIGEKSNKKDL